MSWRNCSLDRPSLGRRSGSAPTPTVKMSTSSTAPTVGTISRRGLLLTLTALLLIPQPSHGFGVNNESPLQYEIQEEVQWGTTIGNIFEEANLHRFYNRTVKRKLTFTFLTQSEHASLFSLDEHSSELRTAARVDRDKICPQLEICDIKMDVAVRPVEYFLAVKVVVRILDLNDNAPRFPQENMASSLSEATAAGILFPIPSATDKDSPKYGVKQYTFDTYTDKFGLNMRNNSDGTIDLHLVLREELDREAEQSYQMRVIASDGENHGSINIDITVVDINDNSPRFTNMSYEVQIREDTPVDTTVVRVHADDPDAGSNGEIVYGFTSRTLRAHGDTFGINPRSGQIYLKKLLDYERSTQYSLAVTAQDQGTDSLPTPTKVVIHIIDINDHVPQITINALTGSGHAEIPEHSEVPYFIAHISVYDPDGGDNGKFNCSLNDPLFRLVQLYDTEFKVMAVAELDREMQAMHDVRIICKDQGVPAQVAISHLPVQVTDENDNTPKFVLDMYYATIHENNPPNAYIIQVSARDKDEGLNGEIEYELEVNARNAFQIDPYKGVLRANMEFDRELIQDLEFQVFAIDKGTPRRTGSTTILVTILDEDDERPTFVEEEFIFDIDENAPSNTNVGRVTATDADLSESSEFTYSLDETDPLARLFQIQPESGLIRTTQSLDREKQPMYVMNVFVKSTNPIHPRDSARVVINVKDVNDNAPVIDFPTEDNRTVQVSNKVPMGYRITRILAHDYDAERNARMTYFISEGNENGEFVIGPKTGEIFVNDNFKQFDHKPFKLVVMVKDHGIPQRISVATLFVVFNSSVPYVPMVHGSSPSTGSRISDVHMVIIICVVLGSAVVATLLVVAIVALKRRDQKNNNQKYAQKNNEVKFTMPDADAQAQNAANKAECLRPQTQLPNGGEGDSLVRRTSPPGSEANTMTLRPAAPPDDDDDPMANVHADQNKQYGWYCGHQAPQSDEDSDEEDVDAAGPPEVQSPCNDKDTDSGCCADMSNHEHCGEDAEGHRLANHIQAQGVPGSILKLKCYHPSGHRRPPTRQSSFSDWLNSESQNLKQSGHVYRVNDLNRAPTQQQVAPQHHPLQQQQHPGQLHPQQPHQQQAQHQQQQHQQQPNILAHPLQQHPTSPNQQPTSFQQQPGVVDGRKVRFNEGEGEVDNSQELCLDSFKNPRKVQMNSYSGTYGGHRNFGANIGPDTIPEEPEIGYNPSDAGNNNPHMTISNSWDEGSVV